MFDGMCYPPTLSPEAWERIGEANGAWPPTAALDAEQTRYSTSDVVWEGDLAQGASGRAIRTRLTYSFVADGTTWGLPVVSATGPSDLSAKLISTFGDLDLGREYMRQGLAAWHIMCGLDYDEVADDGSPEDESTARIATRGDVRLGGLEFGTDQFAAYNAFPAVSGLAVVAGSDMCINTSYFIPSTFGLADFDYRLLRNVVSHEHGHGLGYFHLLPCDDTKLMEPVVSLAFDVVQLDERRGGQRNYGDRFSGNNAPTTAHDVGNLSQPVEHSIFERWLSTNGASGFNGSNQDYFTFTIDAPSNIAIAITPEGNIYSTQAQLIQCFGFGSETIAAQTAGNLAVQVFDSSMTLVASANNNGPGLIETLFLNPLPADTYTVRVYDVGPNPTADQVVQLYSLTIRNNGADAVPIASAGINKRVQANTPCYFMGDINSRVAESGATLVTFIWDIDEDGIYDLAGPIASTQFVSNGVYPVTLRITDSNAMEAFDTIDVTVHGATTTLSDVTPPQGEQGQTVPVTITGANLKNVASASEFLVSGSDVIFVGTPTPNGLGTQVTGLSVQVGASAATGLRTISVSNADGSAAWAGSFEVLAATGGCPDLDGSGVVDLGDLTLVLFNFGTAGPDGDTNGDNIVDLTDLSNVLFSFGMEC
ncbi:MAG: hypothetical protein KDA20_01325 [Phycisphaerales bacterium]|nr:hypothetical protein [Phycisphaerales bacterium]